ncbi:hypothetical protein SDC9_183786 [bioreactor metagenome]|uniref:Uncharacterized protein n=1 Tax=bioreactor metagenome TaxID=1076179 RepID=A0A645HB75_9ZZZZ
MPLPAISCVPEATYPFGSAFAMADAIGCRLCCSAAEANARSSSTGRVALSTRCTANSPSVSVPVLSSTAALTLGNLSSASAPLNSTPALEVMARPAKNVSGMLSTSAHGQEITRKISALRIHSLHSPPPNSGGSTASSAAAAITAGV